MKVPRNAALWVALAVCLVIIVALVWDRAGAPSAQPTEPAQTHTSRPSDAPTATATGSARPTARPSDPRRTGSTTTSRTSSNPGSATSRGSDGLRTVRLEELPAEAAQIHALLLKGGPFSYSKDGTIYRNQNRALPSQQRGWYREFTVPTPGENDRGARRIVVGGCGQQLDEGARRPRTKPCSADNAFYYTDDHYNSFVRIEW